MNRRKLLIGATALAGGLAAPASSPQLPSPRTSIRPSRSKLVIPFPPGGRPTYWAGVMPSVCRRCWANRWWSTTRRGRAAS